MKRELDIGVFYLSLSEGIKTWQICKEKLGTAHGGTSVNGEVWTLP